MPRGGRSVLEITELDPKTMTPHTRQVQTLTCPHCGCVGIIEKPSLLSLLPVCLKCMAYICDKPGCNADCNPIEECIDLAIKYKDLGQPFLLRDANGYTMHDLSLRDQGRPH